jgi:hypothetical protein
MDKIEQYINNLINLSLIYSMEELNIIGNIKSQFENENNINVRASEIIRIFSSPENRHAFAIENSKLNYLIFRFIYT